MRVASVFQVLTCLFSVSLVAAVGGKTDICGECRGSLNIPKLLSPKTFNVFGNINTCLCLSTIPNYIASNSLALSAVSYGGRDAVTNALTSLIYSGNHGTCNYPEHSQPSCQFGNPCGFTCTDGFTLNILSYPPNCVCPKPFTVCNGQCGLFKGCPSSYGKRSLSESSGKLLCPVGLAACQIIGRGTESWECVDTKQDLESCGGCMIQSSRPGFYKEEGVDCTAINGVSDVSCIEGKCRVRRCMPGYLVNEAGDNCVEDHGYSKLISQFDDLFEVTRVVWFNGIGASFFAPTIDMAFPN
ncbi:Protein priA [Psilocybe cubensis]|uniref:Protein priA n=2 Tax=Psilocybe cubensis TaxID=181762 RepID=A0ACB8GI70_PSICU|nr:Protein priA [Psilocybe cubensis]KAH9475155.1 Protein priA [Psilocybe cubensis]